MGKQKTVEQEYQKLTQIEHIIKRPDSYIGSTEITDQTLWVYQNNEKKKFEQKEIKFCPGLYKIFDEILVNAADNYQRDKTMDTIKVNIDVKSNEISVWNNGQSIPIQIHKEYNIYVPELIFGHLLTGSNYDDEQKKVTGGRNGYGAKLANIFSLMFQIETAQKSSNKYFKMVWRNNMSNCSAPILENYKGKEDYTCVKFQPDLKKFNMETLDNDIVSLMKKRVYDMCNIMGNKVKVYLNSELIPIKNFLDYTQLYFQDSDYKYIYDKKMSSDRWEMVLCFSEGQFQQVSFVNSICTFRGGTHVQCVADQLVSQVRELIAKLDKKLEIKPFQIKAKSKLFNKMAKTLNGKTRGRITGISKLDDANDAGGKYADQCTLILTEGDSAKSLAMSGIQTVGRNQFGCFPLRGKFLNVREANTKQITENQEVQSVMKILGLQFEKVYESVKGLRYGRLMIMADQDNDGSHIKGLIINFIHYFWPSLFKLNGFLCEFVTPILKITQGNQTIPFFTQGDYKLFAQQNDIQNWKVKYYKGLGTSTDKEAMEYFKKIKQHSLSFQYESAEDDQKIDLFFNRKKADDRKQWLTNYDPESYIDHTLDWIRYSEFVDKEMIHYAVDSNMRAIPSMMDGLKPGQRKILFACFKRNLRAEIKVAQLQGYVAEHAAYHHGEMSLGATIINMAQNFVGSNNINLLMPIGQFGTRSQGGKDHASARYIFTSLNKITRTLFPEDDDHVLQYLEDDGQLVEPVHYYPIIPMVLVNGAQGIGTGYSTEIHQYNPRELVEQIRRMMRGEEFTPLHPWFKNFISEVKQDDKTGYIVDGKWEFDESDDLVMEIKELPIGKWTKDYKEFLDSLMEGDSPILSDMREYHTNNKVHFWLKFNEGKNFTDYNSIIKNLKLRTTLQTTNLVLFNSNRRIKKYKEVKEILQEFYVERYEKYQQRKSYLLSKIERDLQILENKKRFILEIINETINVRNKKKSLICKELLEKDYVKMSNMTKVRSTKQTVKEQNLESEDELVKEKKGTKSDLDKEYNYLLSMPLWNLTFEKVEDIKENFNQKCEELTKLQEISIEQMWERDLQHFLQVLDEVENIEDQERLGEDVQKKGQNHKRKNKKKDPANKNDDKIKKEVKEIPKLEKEIIKVDKKDKNIIKSPKNKDTTFKQIKAKNINKDLEKASEKEQLTLMERMQLKYQQKQNSQTEEIQPVIVQGQNGRKRMKKISISDSDEQIKMTSTKNAKSKNNKKLINSDDSEESWSE